MPERRRDGIAQPAMIPESLRANGKTAERSRVGRSDRSDGEAPRSGARHAAGVTYKCALPLRAKDIIAIPRRREMTYHMHG